MNKEKLEKAINIFHYKLDIKRELYGNKSVRNVILGIKDAEDTFDVIADAELILEELENLKYEIYRYFELDEKQNVDRLSILESQEKVELAVKLAKVR